MYIQRLSCDVGTGAVQCHAARGRGEPSIQCVAIPLAADSRSPERIHIHRGSEAHVCGAGARQAAGLAPAHQPRPETTGAAVCVIQRAG